MIKAVLNYTFLQNAVLSAILASIVCGIIGTIIVEKRLVMMSGGIAHTSFGGIGLGYYLNIEPIIGAFFFAVLAAIGVVTIRKRINTRIDTLMGLFWAVGMALGVLFISFTSGYPPDISSYLFGNILTVTRFDLGIIGLLTLIVVLAVTALFNYWKAYLFDKEFIFVKGINTTLLEYLLFILIAFSIVVLIKVVGIILVIALLTAPPAIARLFTSKLKNRMQLAVLVGGITSLFGLWFSYQFDISSGASIILILAVVYLAVIIQNKIRQNLMVE